MMQSGDDDDNDTGPEKNWVQSPYGVFNQGCGCGSGVDPHGNTYNMRCGMHLFPHQIPAVIPAGADGREPA